ncbi:hypothetical protein NE237_022599 [Protea cynaroides]|uniref:Uncharacterized protein n=1 Tax=Protea cynaroides TaxID=273540 RepID=A0A9Q0K5F4_9MAGN|nr:hypothetical protein NE237_022599 [Protea cynaroides]
MTVARWLLAAKELKKLIAYNTLVVTELVADIKGEPADTAPQEIITLKELEAKLGKPGQTEIITLEVDLPERDNFGHYMTKMLFWPDGEVTNMPFGGRFTTKKTMDEIFSSRTGEFYEKAEGGVHELALTRLSDSVIQAVVRNHKGEVSSLNDDMLACDKAVPAEPEDLADLFTASLSWQVPEELLLEEKSDPAPD